MKRILLVDSVTAMNLDFIERIYVHGAYIVYLMNSGENYHVGYETNEEALSAFKRLMDQIAEHFPKSIEETFHVKRY